MISKIFPSAGAFKNTCAYVCKDLEQAQVLDAEGVRAHHHPSMAKDFECQREMRPYKQKPVFHAALSFSPQENPSNALMVEIARKYLERIWMTNTQYVIVRHTDKDHPHLHIVANRINNEGRSINHGWNVLRGIRAAKQLTEEYKLVPHVKKNLHLTHRENLRGSDVQRYEIYEAIAGCLMHCRTLEDLEAKLLLRGIGTRYKYDEATGKKLGISFRLGDACFRGVQVDPEFSLKRLERGLREQQEIDMRHDIEQEKTEAQHHRVRLHL